jgi:hypothetical protein
MGKHLINFFGRGGKKARTEAASSAEGTATLGKGATPPPQVPGLSSMEGDTAEAASTADGTVTPREHATPLAQKKPDSYSTEGDIGIKVVADPSNADLEYVYTPITLFD